MTGIVLSGIGAGIIIMPPVANQLISGYGWRTSYIITGIITLVLVIVAAQFLKRDPGQTGQLPYGVDEVKAESLDSGDRGFSLQETIRTRRFWMLCTLFFCFGFGIHTMLVHIVPHAIDIGISAVSAASILSVIGGLSIAGRIGMGSASDRIGNKPALIISVILLSVAFFWLQSAKELWMLYLFAVVFGVAYGGQTVLQSPIVADLFGLRAHGTVLGVIVFGVTLGGAIGPLMAGRIFDITGSYQPAFLISLTLSVIALILMFFLRPSSNEAVRKIHS